MEVPGDHNRGQPGRGKRVESEGCKMSKRKYQEEPGKVKTCYIWNTPREKWPPGVTDAQVKALRQAHMKKKKKGGSTHARKRT